MNGIKVGAVIVAGGLSSRMNDYKPLMKIGNMTMIEMTISNFILLGVDEVVVVTGYRESDLKQKLTGENIKFIHNYNYKTTHMFDSICLGLKEIEKNVDLIFITPVDSPFVQQFTLKRMIDIMLNSSYKLIQPSYDRKNGHPLLIRSEYVNMILKHDGRNGMRGVIANMDKDFLNVSFADSGLILDADTKEDYIKLLKYNKNKEFSSVENINENQECRATVRFNWSCQSIKWYMDSEKHTIYHNKIIEELNPFIVDSRTILDIGSGIGSFAVEFSKKGYNVTAIDKSSLAVETLVNKAKYMKLANIKSINISYEDFIFDNKYDIVFISYMMGLVNKKNIIKIRENVNKHLILIMPYNKLKNDFSINDLYTELGINIECLEQLNYVDITNILKEENIKYILKIVKSEFGQPFNTFDEVVKFIYHYFNLPQEERNLIEKWVRKKLIDLDGKFYLPSIRESVIIII